MAEIINLNKFRKKKAREDATAQAAANRARFGRTRAQKERDAALEREAQHKLDQLRRDTEPDGTPPAAPAT